MAERRPGIFGPVRLPSELQDTSANTLLTDPPAPRFFDLESPTAAMERARRAASRASRENVLDIIRPAFQQMQPVFDQANVAAYEGAERIGLIPEGEADRRRRQEHIQRATAEGALPRGFRLVDQNRALDVSSGRHYQVLTDGPYQGQWAKENSDGSLSPLGGQTQQQRQSQERQQKLYDFRYRLQRARPEIAEQMSAGGELSEEVLRELGETPTGASFVRQYRAIPRARGFREVSPDTIAESAGLLPPSASSDSEAEQVRRRAMQALERLTHPHRQYQLPDRGLQTDITRAISQVPDALFRGVTGLLAPELVDSPLTEQFWRRYERPDAAGLTVPSADRLDSARSLVPTPAGVMIGVQNVTAAEAVAGRLLALGQKLGPTSVAETTKQMFEEATSYWREGGARQWWQDVSRAVTPSNTTLEDEWFSRGVGVIPAELAGIAMMPVHIAKGAADALDALTTTGTTLREDMQRGGELAGVLAADMAQGLSLVMPWNWMAVGDDGPSGIKLAWQRGPIEMFSNLAMLRSGVRKVGVKTGRFEIKSLEQRRAEITRQQERFAEAGQELAELYMERSQLDAAVSLTGKTVDQIEAGVNQARAITTAITEDIKTAQGLVERWVSPQLDKIAEAWVEFTQTPLRHSPADLDGSTVSGRKSRLEQRLYGIRTIAPITDWNNFKSEVGAKIIREVSEQLTEMGQDILGRAENAMQVSLPKQIVESVTGGPDKIANTRASSYANQMERLDTRINEFYKRYETIMPAEGSVPEAALLGGAKTLREAFARSGGDALITILEREMRAIDDSLNRLAGNGWDNLHLVMPQKAAAAIDAALLVMSPLSAPGAAYKWWARRLAKAKTASARWYALDYKERMPNDILEMLHETSAMTREVEIHLRESFARIPEELRPTVRQFLHLEHELAIRPEGAGASKAIGRYSDYFDYSQGDGIYRFKEGAVLKIANLRASKQHNITKDHAAVVSRHVDDGEFAGRRRQQIEDNNRSIEAELAKQKDIASGYRSDGVTSEATLNRALKANPEYQASVKEVAIHRKQTKQLEAELRARSGDAPPMLVGGELYRMYETANEYAVPIADMSVQLSKRAKKLGMFVSSEDLLRLWWPNVWKQTDQFLSKGRERISKAKASVLGKPSVAWDIERQSMLPDPFAKPGASRLMQRKSAAIKIEKREQYGMSSRLDDEVDAFLKFANDVEKFELYQRIGREIGVTKQVIDYEVGQIDTLKSQLEDSSRELRQAESRDGKDRSEAQEALRTKVLSLKGRIDYAESLRDGYIKVDEQVGLLRPEEHAAIIEKVNQKRVANAREQQSLIQKELDRIKDKEGVDAVRDELRSDLQRHRKIEQNPELAGEYNRPNAFGAMVGKYIPAELYIELYNMEQLALQSRGFIPAVTRMWKRAKTAWSVATASRNILTNILVWAPMANISLTNPLNLQYYARALHDMSLPFEKRSKQFHTAWKEGALDGTFTRTEMSPDIANTLNGMLSHVRDVGSPVEWGMKTALGLSSGGSTLSSPTVGFTSSVAKSMRAIVSAPGKFYSSSDDLFRLAAHYKLQAVGSSMLRGTAFAQVESAMRLAEQRAGVRAVYSAKPSTRELSEASKTVADLESRLDSLNSQLNTAVAGEVELLRKAIETTELTLEAAKTQMSNRERALAIAEAHHNRTKRTYENQNVSDELAQIRSEFVRGSFIDYENVPGWVKVMRAPFRPVQIVQSPKGARLEPQVARRGGFTATFGLMGQPFVAYPSRAIPLMTRWIQLNPIMANLHINVHDMMSRWNLATAVIDEEAYAEQIGRNPTVSEVISEAEKPDLPDVSSWRRTSGEESKQSYKKLAAKRSQLAQETSPEKRRLLEAQIQNIEGALLSYQGGEQSVTALGQMLASARQQLASSQDSAETAPLRRRVAQLESELRRAEARYRSPRQVRRQGITREGGFGPGVEAATSAVQPFWQRGRMLALGKVLPEFATTALRDAERIAHGVDQADWMNYINTGYLTPFDPYLTRTSLSSQGTELATRQIEYLAMLMGHNPIFGPAMAVISNVDPFYGGEVRPTTRPADLRTNLAIEQIRTETARSEVLTRSMRDNQEMLRRVDEAIDDPIGASARSTLEFLWRSYLPPTAPGPSDLWSIVSRQSPPSEAHRIKGGTQFEVARTAVMPLFGFDVPPTPGYRGVIRGPREAAMNLFGSKMELASVDSNLSRLANEYLSRFKASHRNDVLPIANAEHIQLSREGTYDLKQANDAARKRMGAVAYLVHAEGIRDLFVRLHDLKRYGVRSQILDEMYGASAAFLGIADLHDPALEAMTPEQLSRQLHLGVSPTEYQDEDYLSDGAAILVRFNALKRAFQEQAGAFKARGHDINLLQQEEALQQQPENTE